MALITGGNLDHLKKASAVVEAELQTFKKILLYIDEFTNLSYSAQRYSDVKEICKILFNNVPFMITTLEPTYISRVRRNTKSLFASQEDISYNKNLESITAGRFNMEGQSVFYGCLSTYEADGRSINYGNQCPMFEVFKEISGGGGVKFPVFFTIGFWKAKAAMDVLNLCFEDDHLKANPALSEPVNDFIGLLKAQCSNPVREYTLSVWRYFSSLSRRWDGRNHQNYYYMLTAFFDAFMETYHESTGEVCEAIIYPSAMTQAKGLNIVMTPDLVNRYLTLDQVQMYSLRSRSIEFGYEPITPVVAVKNNTFVFDADFKNEFERFTYNWEE